MDRTDELKILLDTIPTKVPKETASHKELIEMRERMMMAKDENNQTDASNKSSKDSKRCNQTTASVIKELTNKGRFKSQEKLSSLSDKIALQHDANQKGLFSYNYP